MSDKQTVTLIGPSSRFLSGISYYTTYLANALSEKYSVQAVLFRKMLPKRLFPGAARVGKILSTISYNTSVNMQEYLDWYNPITWYQAYRTASKSKVCVFEWWTSSVAHMYLVIGLLLRLKGVPIILEFHEVVDTLEEAILPLRIYSKVMGRLIRRLANRYVTHSVSDQNLVAERYQIPIEKISVIPHGLYDQYPVIEPDAAKKHLGITASNVILFFGLLRPYKGAKNLIHAFEQLPQSLKNTTVLLIAGETWEDRETLMTAEISQDHDKILLFSKYISDEEVPYFFSAANLLALPYTRASQSGVAHIGISYGMPIVASQVGGLAESLGQYEGTYFVIPENVAELSHMLETVLTEEHKKYPLPESMRWDHIATTWKMLIDQI
ncbi:MAG TPA: glycosyltransferase [Methanocorpusculum sp.]|nr:glycosyltransferase [Methanocorpusculum sp.]HJK03220.1 glycosyltransferase [Methanocorpusculum sp.]HJK06905.1 glycosyltransferase [Methanocorpusculum sp.]HJK15634.1 glycosyltransferase [Methanocorpusculum sp.]HJK16802.1 glycosyltransferase [Methanocorpusculum sp.]